MRTRDDQQHLVLTEAMDLIVGAPHVRHHRQVIARSSRSTG